MDLMDQHDLPDPSLETGMSQHVRTWASIAAAIGATAQVPTQAAPGA